MTTENDKADSVSRLTKFNGCGPTAGYDRVDTSSHSSSTVVFRLTKFKDRSLTVEHDITVNIVYYI